MHPDPTLRLLMTAATIGDGVLAGASIDRSIIHLPVRRHIGASAYSAYSKARELTPVGIRWYAGLGGGSALLTVLSAITARANGTGRKCALPLYTAGVLAVLHSLVTARAAPINLKQRAIDDDDEAALTELLDSFARWQSLRATLQIGTFAAMVWALVVDLKQPMVPQAKWGHGEPLRKRKHWESPFEIARADVTASWTDTHANGS